jgi:DGQHR domain-containing protein
MKSRIRVIERKALRVAQPSGRELFLLTLSGEELLRVAGISRVSRDNDGKLIGYQRAEVRKHVREIAEYLQTPEMILAHPLILCFGSQVRFVSSRGAKTSDGLASAGMLLIPLTNNADVKPAWIVDGQQRALAISMCANRKFAVPVCAFVADDVEIQRDQFLRINNSRPLPRGLITELLPEVSSPLPARMALRKIPAAICELLNREDASPFKGLIRRPSSTAAEKRTAVVTDTVIVQMIEESLSHASGCLFPYRNVATGECDHLGIWSVLVTFWTAVRDAFPEAWGKPPARSRLMHGVGIRSLGKLMDRMMSSIDPRTRDAVKSVRRELGVIAPLCHWTSGQWADLGGLEWNELQTLHKHLSLLSNYLIRAYLERRHA